MFGLSRTEMSAAGLATVAAGAGKGAGRYLLLADDPAAGHDIPALCTERGWQLLANEADRYEIEVG